MQKSTFNFAAVFATMALLVFSYITFLGLVYWKGGDFKAPAVMTIIMMAIVASCVFIMCKAKATRWKKIGGIGQSVFGLIILGTFILAAFPFTNFLKAAKDSEDIRQLTDGIYQSAIYLDNAYHKYADNRVKNYQRQLQAISNSRSSATEAGPAERLLYEQSIKGADGGSDREKIHNLSNSLRDRLLPENAGPIIVQRHKWLENIRDVNIWNPMTPANINRIDETVNKWLDNYRQLSLVSYLGERPDTFTYDNFDDSITLLTDSYRKFHSPSFIAIVIALLCFGIMLLPYFTTEQSLAGKKEKTRNGNTLYE